MPLFPKLATGAIAQYPLTRVTEQRTRVIRYVDGSEQRISRMANPLRRWAIQLDQLTEREASEVLAFFAQRRGRAEEFEFEDPGSGTVIPHCRFEQDEIKVDFRSDSGGRTTLLIRTGG